MIQKLAKPVAKSASSRCHRSRRRQRLKAVSIRTEPYPAFPTDMQAQFMAINSVAEGAAVIRERSSRNRFMHAVELIRLGADIKIDGNNALVTGVPRLMMARRSMATDLRASASLVIAGLVAQGETLIERIYHRSRLRAHRGKLTRLGASVRRYVEAQPAIEPCGKIAGSKFLAEPKERTQNITRMSAVDITIALSKGRIFEETLPLAGGRRDRAARESGNLAQADHSRPIRDDVRVVIVRATDAPTYVQYGAADIGVAGKDVLIEHGGDGLYQPLDLKIAKCRMMVAIPAGFDYENAVRQGAAPQGGDQVHQHRARALCRQGRTRRSDQTLRFDGTGAAGRPADAIVDLVSTGSTLKANNLVAVEHIIDISSRLIVNQAALKLKREKIVPILDAFAGRVVADDRDQTFLEQRRRFRGAPRRPAGVRERAGRIGRSRRRGDPGRRQGARRCGGASNTPTASTA